MGHLTISMTIFNVKLPGGRDIEIGYHSYSLTPRFAQTWKDWAAEIVLDVSRIRIPTQTPPNTARS